MSKKPKSTWKLAKGKFAWIKRNKKGEKVKQGVADTMKEARQKAGTATKSNKSGGSKKSSKANTPKKKNKTGSKTTKSKSKTGGTRKMAKTPKLRLFLLGSIAPVAAASVLDAVDSGDWKEGVKTATKALSGYDTDARKFDPFAADGLLLGYGPAALLGGVKMLFRMLRIRGAGPVSYS